MKKRLSMRVPMALMVFVAVLNAVYMFVRVASHEWLYALLYGQLTFFALWIVSLLYVVQKLTNMLDDIAGWRL